MKVIDNIRLIFSFYLNNDSLNNEINWLHLKLLSKYINRFNEVVFCLIVDDSIDKNVIIEFQKIIIGLYNKNITFKIYQNTTYRESYVLYNEIATKLDKLDGLTFFGHNKGVSDTFGIDNVKMWVMLLYFFSFEINLPSNHMNGTLAYGPLKSVNCNFKYGSAVQNKYNWTYCGTFFWLKCQQLSEYMENNNISLPKLTNRWYSEMFLGNVMPEREGVSFDDIYFDGEDIQGAYISEMIEFLYYNHNILNEFKEYYEENFDISFVC